jgi:hypothetical protein
MTRSKKAPGDYAVGYGKPPVHTRFRKGVSGNPGGRPAKAPLERIKTLALSEAYRAITVKDGGVTATLPAIRAVLRRQLALAAKGNGPAQRAIIATIAAIEEERTIVESQIAAEEAKRRKPMDDAEAIRRIAYLLNLPEYDLKAREWQERLRKDEQEAQEKLRAMRAAEAGRAAPRADRPTRSKARRASGTVRPRAHAKAPLARCRIVSRGKQARRPACAGEPVSDERSGEFPVSRKHSLFRATHSLFFLETENLWQAADIIRRWGGATASQRAKSAQFSNIPC